ncbi:MAG: hypothetical protein WBE39_14625 [Candidatus Competibacter sp.]
MEHPRAAPLRRRLEKPLAAEQRAGEGLLEPRAHRDAGAGTAKRAPIEHRRVALQVKRRAVAEARFQVDLAGPADCGLKQRLAGGELAQQALGQPAGQTGFQPQPAFHEIQRPRLDQDLAAIERHPHHFQPDASLVE